MAGRGDFATKSENSCHYPACVLLNPVFAHSVPRARSVLAVDTYVSVPVCIVFKKMMYKMPAVSHL